MIGIDLFAGAGGLSLGAEWAGIDVVAAIEMEKNAVATYKKNHKDTIVINEDIYHVDSKTDLYFLDLHILITGSTFLSRMIMR